MRTVTAPRRPALRAPTPVVPAWPAAPAPWLPRSTPALAATPWRGAGAATHAPAASAHEEIAGSHPLVDERGNAVLHARAERIGREFDRIESLLADLAQRQFEAGFADAARDALRTTLRLDVPPQALAAHWAEPLDARRLYARLVVGTFGRLMAEGFDAPMAPTDDGENAAALVRRWGFHAIDISPCADGRLSGVIDYVLRVPAAVVRSRRSSAGALFDVEEALRRWESVELERWRHARPNAPQEATRYLKLGIYHFSRFDPAHEGCAAHGSDALRAASTLLQRLQQFEQAVARVHGEVARPAILLVGVDTDTDAIRVHVPDAQGRIDPQRSVDSRELFEATRTLARAAAKEAIRAAVAACAGTAADDAATEGMRWFCAFLVKNNFSQLEAVRRAHRGRYADAGHTERLIVVGDPVDEVQLRNLAFQAQFDTVEEGAADLDIGIAILARHHAPRRLAVPLLVHARFDPRVDGARERAEGRVRRMRAAIEARWRAEVDRAVLDVHGMVWGGMGHEPATIEPPVDAMETEPRR
ncbi:MAG TPA: carboxysome shell carbonic anhydrase [Burkholderiaceae bacterium]|nr:carboxysome shell carbonic anhydrase [Burkholderiaceae bacterium]